MKTVYVLTMGFAAAEKVALKHFDEGLPSPYLTRLDAYIAWLGQPVPMQSRYTPFAVTKTRTGKLVTTPLNLEECQAMLEAYQ
jgi:hypothetical protein